jgi:hypothetical protein
LIAELHRRRRGVEVPVGTIEMREVRPVLRLAEESQEAALLPVEDDFEKAAGGTEVGMPQISKIAVFACQGLVNRVLAQSKKCHFLTARSADARQCVMLLAANGALCRLWAGLARIAPGIAPQEIARRHFPS